MTLDREESELDRNNQSGGLAYAAETAVISAVIALALAVVGEWLFCLMWLGITALWCLTVWVIRRHGRFSKRNP